MPADIPPVMDHNPDRGDLPSLSVRRPILAIVMNLLIVLAGIAALRGVEVRELPNIERPVVSVTVDCPGAAPETMDAEVTRLLEGAASRVPGVQSIRADSEEGNARLRLYFQPSIDINIAASDVREAMGSVQRRLPEGVEDIVVRKADDDAEPINRMAISSQTLDAQQLTKLIEDRVVPALLSVDGVADVRVFGSQSRHLNIVIDPLRLASHGIGIDQVADALRQASLDVPAGSVRTDAQNFLVRAQATSKREEEIERLVITGTTRISDIASVHYGPARPTARVRLDGQPVMGAGVIRKAQSNTIEISTGVDRVIEDLNLQLDDLTITKIADDATYIRGSVYEVLLALVIGFAAVVTVILLFLGKVRLMLIPAVTIPVALIGALAGIWLLGFSVNILTLLALVLATGLVVDDAIVVVENVERVRRSGVKPLAAAVLGTRQVFFAVIATTVTLASVFVPIAFLPGRAGSLFVEFGFVLALAVVISSFVALSLCPMMASRLMASEPTDSQPGLRRPLVALGNGLVSFYGRTLGILLKAPLLSVGVALGIASSAIAIFQSLDQELVPNEDRGLMYVWMRGPDGANLEYSDRQIRKIEGILQPYRDSGEVRHVYAVAGGWDPNAGYVMAPLAPWDERSRPVEEFMNEVQTALNDIPGIRASAYQRNSLSIRSNDSGIEFAVTGSDYQRIAVAAEALMDAMERNVQGIRTPRMGYSTTQPEMRIRIDRERAAVLGIELGDIASTLRAMVDGTDIADLNVDDESVPIRIQSRYGAVNDTDDLRNLYVATASGRLIPLSSLITIEESGAATELERVAQRRAIEVDARLDADVPLEEVVSSVRALAAEILPPGMDIVMQGQAETLEETTREMAFTFGIALLVVLLVLAAQFESFASAVVVMVTVPFGLAAAVLAIWLAGMSLNVYSQIGLVMLIGLMAKNGILIVEFANQLRDQGWTVADAIHEASMVRLRPVMMTMLSTILAGVPLIVGTGPGAEARSAIGWVVFGGLGIAILAVIYITPVVYLLLAPLARSRGAFGKALGDELTQARAETTNQTPT